MTRFTVAVLLLVTASACGGGSSGGVGSSKGNTVSAEAPDPRTASIAEARAWLVGDWTAKSEQAGKESQPGYWEFLRFGPEGQFLTCSAMGGDDQWTNCKVTSYRITKERYSNTGEDYFRIRTTYRGCDGCSESTSMVVLIIAGAIIEQRITDDGGIRYRSSVDFERGNRHPHAPAPPEQWGATTTAEVEEGLMDAVEEAPPEPAFGRFPTLAALDSTFHGAPIAELGQELMDLGWTVGRYLPGDRWCIQYFFQRMTNRLLQVQLYCAGDGVDRIEEQAADPAAMVEDTTVFWRVRPPDDAPASAVDVSFGV